MNFIQSAVPVVAVAIKLLLLLNMVNCSLEGEVTLVNQNQTENTTEISIIVKNISSPAINETQDFITASMNSTLPQQDVANVLHLLIKSIREAAHNYIASRLKRIVFYPAVQQQQEDDKSTSTNSSTVQKAGNLTTIMQIPTQKANKLLHPQRKRQMLGAYLVPVIPEGVKTPKWVPGELIASQITNREIQLVDSSVFGPLKSVTMFPAVMSSILVFKKRYHPEILAKILKYNFGIESEPNGIIAEAPIDVNVLF